MEEGFVLMNLSKCRRWRAHRVIAKQQSKREQTHPLYLHAAEKYEKVESVNTHSNYETVSKKLRDKKRTDLFFVFCEMCLNSKKTISRSFKRISWKRK